MALTALASPSFSTSPKFPNLSPAPIQQKTNSTGNVPGSAMGNSSSTISAMQNQYKQNNISPTASTTAMAHQSASDELAQRKRELDDYQRVLNETKANQSQADAVTKGRTDYQLQMMKLLDPLTRGETLKGTAFEGLGDPFSQDQAKNYFNQAFSPEQERLSSLGLGRSGAVIDAEKKAEQNTALASDAQQADEQKFLLNFMQGAVPTSQQMAAPVTSPDIISQLQPALNTAMSGDQQMYQQWAAEQARQQAARDAQQAKYNQIQDTLKTPDKFDSSGIDAGASSLKNTEFNNWFDTQQRRAHTMQSPAFADDKMQMDQALILKMMELGLDPSKMPSFLQTGGTAMKPYSY